MKFNTPQQQYCSPKMRVKPLYLEESFLASQQKEDGSIEDYESFDLFD